MPCHTMPLLHHTIPLLKCEVLVRSDSMVGNDDATGHWIPQFSMPLGAPLADAVYDASTTVWSRRFTHGVNVTFNAITGKGAFFPPFFFFFLPSPVDACETCGGTYCLVVSALLYQPCYVSLAISAFFPCVFLVGNFVSQVSSSIQIPCNILQRCASGT